MTSDLGRPIKNLHEFSLEEFKIALSDWSQMQGFGNCFSEVVLDFIDRLDFIDGQLAGHPNLLPD